ncbi:MAG: hypothetical protein KA354_25085 [Phycisphaerae bacterium]|nr:hypothetical protein [Phycisphaerae bacterium]
MTTIQTTGAQARRRRIQPHRLGMGWHYVWEYNPPIEHLVQSADGSPCYWREAGETSEGCIMLLADCFAARRLGTTAREIYRQAYAQADGEALDDEWLATQTLCDEWGPHTVLPTLWRSAQVNKLFEDLEDVNYHSFLGRLAELIEQRAPALAKRLDGWCKMPPNTPQRLTSPAHA